MITQSGIYLQSWNPGGTGGALQLKNGIANIVYSAGFSVWDADEVLLACSASIGDGFSIKMRLSWVQIDINGVPGGSDVSIVSSQAGVVNTNTINVNEWSFPTTAWTTGAGYNVPVIAVPVMGPQLYIGVYQAGAVTNNTFTAVITPQRAGGFVQP